MTLDIASVMKGAWLLWKRDRVPLLGIAGLLLFLPQFASLLLMQPQPEFPGLNADETALQAYMTASRSWSMSYGVGLLAAAVLVVLGAAGIILLYLSPERPDVKGALGAALRRLPRFLLAFLLVSLPVGISLQLVPLLILPALYVGGRLLLVLPALAAERPISVAGAFRHSWALSKGHGLMLAGTACITVFAGPVLALPFMVLGRALNGAPLANPVVAAILDAGAAGALTVGALGAALVQVLLYRRLTQPNLGT